MSLTRLGCTGLRCGFEQGHRNRSLGQAIFPFSIENALLPSSYPAEAGFNLSEAVAGASQTGGAWVYLVPRALTGKRGMLNTAELAGTHHSSQWPVFALH